RHSRAILGDGKVAGTITISGRGEDNLGIQFEGIAKKIGGSRFDLAQKHYIKRRKQVPEETDDVLQGDSWYILKPRRIELIYEEHFGFDKQIIEL
ncbi:MAG: hypothetical protein HZA36_01740, partial [Parcubacteria group bacterium]|nr:hypothetical protein [Parcubacteria group bacterium]